MTYNLSFFSNDKIEISGYRAPTGRSSDYIFNKKSKIISCNLIKPLGCSNKNNKVHGLTQNDYLLVKKGFFRS